MSLSSVLLFAQDIRPEEKVILGDKMVFMGIDFSMARFYNPEKFNESIYIRDHHGPAWGQIDEYLLKRDLKYDLQKKELQTTVAVFDSSFKSLDSSWVSDKIRPAHTDAEIQAHLKSYDVQTSEPLAMVILIDQMNAVSKIVDISAVYFDPKNKTVLKVIHAQGIGAGFGYTTFWQTGIELAYRDLIVKDDAYLKGLKKFFVKK
jgi:hypothetical protein